MRAIVAGVLLAGIGVAFVALRGNNDGEDPPPRAGITASASAADSEHLGALDDRPPVVGQQAPDFILRTPGGDDVRLSELRGKVVFVNFWATWCAPCKKELPDIQALYAEMAPEGLEVLAINVEEDGASASDFFDDLSVDVPILLDTRGEVYAQYRLQGLPDSFFVDRDGNLAAVHYGGMSEEKMRERLEVAGLP